MRVGVPKESREGERRVALIPDVVQSLTGGGIEVAVESGAGESAGHPDSEYSDAGASVGSADDAWAPTSSSRSPSRPSRRSDASGPGRC